MFDGSKMRDAIPNVQDVTAWQDVIDGCTEVAK